jgi:hypothetical protein
MTSPFAGISAAKASRDSEYFRAGRYLTYIRSFITRANRSKVPVVIFELTVVAVLDPSAAANEPKGAHRVGESVSWLMQLPKDTTMPNLKAAIKAITGVPEEEVTESFCDALASANQPMAGFFVEWDNRVIKTKKGEPFTQVKARRRWSADEVKQGVPETVLASLKLDTSRADS